MSYCSIHNHTEYTNLKILDCINRIPKLIDKAMEYGFNGLAITDHECISGHIEALTVADKIKEKNPDFKIILGNEIYLIKKEEYKNAEKYFHFILLACDEIGHRQLRELSTRAWGRMYMEKGQRRCPTFYEDFEEVVGENKGHLIGSTACLGGALGYKILQHDADYINDLLEWGVNTFGPEKFFLEMQDSDSEDQKIVNRYIKQFSDQTGIPYIITQDAHYLDKDDLAIFEKFLNSREEKEREIGDFYKYTYVKSENEMHQILSYLPKDVVQKGIENTQLIYNQIKNYDLRRDTIVPERKIPIFDLSHSLKDWYDTCPNIKFYSQSEYEQDRFLLYLIEQGIKNKNFKITEVEAKRIDTELDTLKYISEMINSRLSAYLNLVVELIDVAWGVSFVGVSRGSALSFLINYLIGITQANPMLYDIPYWRFLNRESVTKGMTAADGLPDVDMDFSGVQQDKIMQLMREYYGEDHVLNTLTYKRETLKSAILTACRGLGISVEEGQSLSAMVPISRGHVYSLKECLEGNEENDFDPAPQLISAIKTYPKLYETVEKIEGLISNSGIHASAVFFSSKPYVEYCGMMRAPNGTPITCYDYRGVNAVGLLKMDFLYTDCQTKLMKCIELMLKQGVIEWQGSLRSTYNKYLHPDTLQYENDNIWATMAENKIPDLFQFDSVMGSVCIKKTKPTSVKQLGAANAVMRLMAQEGEEPPLERYSRFRNNISLWYEEMEKFGLTKEEQKVLEEECLGKFGTAPEQEDMMLLVQRPEISNFTLGEANKMRKAISKKQLKKIQHFKELYFSKSED